MTPSTLVPLRGLPHYMASARENLTTPELVDAEIERYRRFMAGAANGVARERYQTKLRFLGKLRAEVATGDLFAGKELVIA